MLKLQAIGNLGRDPEIIEKGEWKYARFTIGTNRKVKGEKITTWVSVTCFGDKRVEFIDQYIKKGTKVFIEGDAQARAYTTKSGEAAASLDVTIGAFDGKLEICSAIDSSGPVREERAKPKPQASQWAGDDDMDDVPF
jgi:single-strand DNA-binding protein